MSSSLPDNTYAEVILVLPLDGERLRIPTFLGDVAFETASSWMEMRVDGDLSEILLNGDMLPDRAVEKESLRCCFQ